MNKNGNFRKLVNYIPSIIILFIAGCAFLASFIQSDYSTEVNLLLEEYTDKQTELDRLVVEIQGMMNEDIAYQLTGDEWMVSALDLAQDWEVKRSRGEMNANISDNLITRINSYFDMRLWLYRGSNIGTIEAFFNVNTDAQEYVVANQSAKGFDFAIPRAEWEPSGIGNAKTMNATLQQYPFPATIIPFILAHPTNPQLQVTMQIKRFNTLLQSFVIERQISLNELNTRIEELKASVNQISNGVALITVATILSAAMAERISSTETSTGLSVIRADVLKDDSYINRRSNKLSIIILASAALLASGGLIVPILLT